MDTDPVDYRTLLPQHICPCGSAHVLQEYPVDFGWVVAVVCPTCRTKTGLPLRYSIESEVLGSIGKASIVRHRLLEIGVAA